MYAVVAVPSRLANNDGDRTRIQRRMNLETRPHILKRNMKNMTADYRVRPLTTAALGCAIFSIAAAMPALADTASNPPTMTVGYSDLDVSQPHGAVVLYGRIHTAAQLVCAPSAGSMSGFPGPSARSRACVQNAITMAVTSVDRPALSAVFASNYPNVAVGRVASL
jgi:UrcA family protein